MHRKFRTTIRLTVVTVFLLSTTLTAAVAIGLQYYFGQKMAHDAAEDLYNTASISIASELNSIGRINTNIIDLLSDNPELADPEHEAVQLKIFTKILEKNPLYYGIYLGRADGHFFEVVNLNTSERARRALKAMPTDRWLIVTMREGANGRERHYRYLDETMRQRASRSEVSDFDVSSRPWYASAARSDVVEVSAPYLFAQLGVPGRTFSKRVAGSDTVVAVDMTLETTSEYLGSLALADQSDLYLFDNDGKVIASSIEGYYARPKLPIPEFELTEAERQLVTTLPVLKVSNELNWPPLDYAQTGSPRGYAIDLIRMIAAMTGIQLEFVNGYAWPDLVQKFNSGELDMLHPVALTAANATWGLPGVSIIDLPFALLTQEDQRPLSDLSDLGQRTLAIGAGWSVLPVVRAAFPELNIIEVPSILKGMEMVLAGEVYALLDNELTLRHLASHYFLSGLQYHSDIGFGRATAPDALHILVHNDQLELRALIDRAIAALGPKQRDYLSKTWLELDGEQQLLTSPALPSRQLIDMANDPKRQSHMVETVVAGKDYLGFVASAGQGGAINIGILSPLDDVLAPFLGQVKLSILITAGFLLLVLPLSWLFANPIVRPVKQLAIQNDKVRRREYNDVRAGPL